MTTEEKKEKYKADYQKRKAYMKAYREANKEKAAAWRESNRQELKVYFKNRHNENKEKLSAQNKEYYEKNKEKIIKKVSAYYEQNKESISKYKLEHYKNNQHIYVAASKKRKASRIQRTPNWLTSKDFEAIELVYAEAKNREVETGIKHHVDHIIPLQGKNVSGLHVPANLQIISATDNLRKSNRYQVDA